MKRVEPISDVNAVLRRALAGYVARLLTLCPDAMIVVALVGLGLLYMPGYFVRRVDHGGELDPVLSEWCHVPNAFWIVFADRPRMSS